MKIPAILSAVTLALTLAPEMASAKPQSNAHLRIRKEGYGEQCISDYSQCDGQNWYGATCCQNADYECKASPDRPDGDYWTKLCLPKWDEKKGDHYKGHGGYGGWNKHDNMMDKKPGMGHHHGKGYGGYGGYGGWNKHDDMMGHHHGKGYGGYGGWNKDDGMMGHHQHHHDKGYGGHGGWNKHDDMMDKKPGMGHHHGKGYGGYGGWNKHDDMMDKKPGMGHHHGKGYGGYGGWNKDDGMMGHHQHHHGKGYDGYNDDEKDADYEKDVEYESEENDYESEDKDEYDSYDGEKVEAWGDCTNMKYCVEDYKCIVQSDYYAQCMPYELEAEALCGQTGEQNWDYAEGCPEGYECKARYDGDKDLRCLAY